MKPLVIAHRGSSGDAPENTMQAFELALRQKADGLELDVFLTRDKKIVVTHDDHCRRLAGCDRWVRQSTLTELRELDYGQGEKIPTLEDVFDLCEKHMQIINVEIKSTGTFTDGIEAALIDLVKRRGIADKVIVSSFNFLHLLRLKKIAPEIKRGYLVWQESWINKRALPIRLTSPQSMNLDQSWATPERLAHYGRFAPEIWLWTVNELDDMKRWIRQAPVKAIITNYPARLKALLEGT